LIAYNQLLEFVPTTDFGTATSISNTVTPVSLTIADLNTGLANYESELIKLSSVTISDFTGSGTPDGTFQSSKNYPIADASGASVLRTNFSQADYMGQAFPTSPIDMVCLVGNYNGTAQVTPRSLADITVLANEEIQIEGFSMYPNPANNRLFVNTANNLIKNIQIFDILGKQVVSETLEGNKLDLNLNSGVYIIKIEEAGKLAIQKLVIE
jgi:hypothetical protein